MARTISFVCVFVVGFATATSICQGQVAGAPPFDWSMPTNADVPALQEFLKRAKGTKPASLEEHKAIQTAIRDAAQRLREMLADRKSEAAYRDAEFDEIAASVSLMANFGEDAKETTRKRVEEFLRSREELSIQDIQTGMLAAVMLELQPNKAPARDMYNLLDELLAKDQRKEMQRLRANLQSAVRRLDLLGKKLDLQSIAIDGHKISIDDYAGKYLLVVFFATWSEPCLAEIPHLKAIYGKYRDRGLSVLGVSIDSDESKLKEYLAGAELPWPVVHDNAKEGRNRMQAKFGITVLPVILLLNKEGTVVSLEAIGGELDRLVSLLFESPTPAAPLSTTSEQG
ncbi:MAG: TlpA family protein disulfide reductase [Planctomycetales bacterium]|nr:TlpA family protein disulfide reductase [Planctomycetales bacterium]